ncbi:MAG: type I pullulanase [Clostridia bacterium]|nr:type I pullulanase [Clostridia bacterium]
MSDFFDSKEFHEAYYYDGNDLGCTYSKEETSFRVWAPLAEKAALVLYRYGDACSGEEGISYEMKRDVKGTWCITLEGDRKGLYYTYKVTNHGVEEEAADPYAKACGVNGDRSAVVDLSLTDPDGWLQDRLPSFTGIEDAIIYELHIRDLAMDPNSGIRNIGKYIEFLEEGTKGPDGIATGVDHLKELGITHLHILPTYDFGSIDEKTLYKNNFNWGYDPKNYNIPEGSYATDPYDPATRIREFKQMVQALHKHGIRIVFDGVYNHTHENIKSWFHKIVPGYYYRMTSDGWFHNGSGCGNETASERSMFRKYMIDSVKYWAREYHIDGFRFDLMGLHDIDTMNEIRKELSKINPGILLFGEGWDLGNLTRECRAIQAHADRMPGIGFFNDNVRDNLKGPWSYAGGHGFVDGEKNFELEVMAAVTGSITYNEVVKDYNLHPGQSINYIANHDNHTLWDKLTAANSNVSEDVLKKMHKLAHAIILTCQGVAYLHAGEDFLRTKGGNSNSFSAPDSINALDWSRKAEHLDVFTYFKGLIRLRKEHPGFRMNLAEMVRSSISFINSPRNTVAYVIKGHANGDQWKNIFVMYNANPFPVTADIPQASWNIVADGERAGIDTIGVAGDQMLNVGPLSAMVMYTQDNIEVEDLFENKKVIKTRVNSDVFFTSEGSVAAEERVMIRDQRIYLPLMGLLKAMESSFEITGSQEVLLITNRKAGQTVQISMSEGKFRTGEKEANLGNDLIDVYGKLMVSRDFAEDFLNTKVLADFRRYQENTYRAEYHEPDVYILYR